MSNVSDDPFGLDTIHFTIDTGTDKTDEQVETLPGVAVISINRPSKLNALNRQVLRDLRTALHSAVADFNVCGVVITGAGEKSFVAGADISEFKSLSPLEAQKLALLGQELFTEIENSSKPVVAAVNGYALGGGCELAMACHIRLASPNALFGQPEVGLGLIPGYGGTQRLPRLIGSGRATEMILTGKPVTAERAEAMGLVNHVVDGEDLVAEAIAMIRKISRQSPTAVSLALAAIRRADSDLQTGLYHEAALFGQAFSTDDFREGVNAFLEKRTPKFSGR